MAKYDRRKERDNAIGDLNGLAEEAGLDTVGYRAGAEAVADLYVRLGRSLSLTRARTLSLSLALARSRSRSLALARARLRSLALARVMRERSCAEQPQHGGNTERPLIILNIHPHPGLYLVL